MGAAIQSFPGARLVCVPRTRFVPVKTTNDLLILRSDVYRMTDGMIVEPIPERVGRLPFIDLDKERYGVLEQFESRFPGGPPSLRDAERLVVRGDVTFERGVVVRGSVQLETSEPLRVGAGSILEGEDLAAGSRPGRGACGGASSLCRRGAEGAREPELRCPRVAGRLTSDPTVWLRRADRATSGRPDRGAARSPRRRWDRIASPRTGAARRARRPAPSPPGTGDRSSSPRRRRRRRRSAPRSVSPRLRARRDTRARRSARGSIGRSSRRSRAFRRPASASARRRSCDGGPFPTRRARAARAC